eukprot:scaffold140882_cov187-Phaeocystis_antarctica.AAC.2
MLPTMISTRDLTNIYPHHYQLSDITHASGDPFRAHAQARKIEVSLKLQRSSTLNHLPRACRSVQSETASTWTDWKAPLRH